MEFHTVQPLTTGDVTTSTATYLASTQSIVNVLDVAAFMPKMKVIDFFEAIIKMYNLVVIPNSATDLYIDTLDNWYAAGTVHDITKYIVKDSFKIARSKIPSNINFTYSEPKTFIALNHFDTFNEVAADLSYTDDNVDLDGGTLDVTLGFEQLKYERLVDEDTDAFTTVQWGYSVDKDEAPELPEPHIFHAIDQNISSNSIALLTGTTPTQISSSVYMPFHGNTTTAPAFSTFWGSSLNEWDGVGVVNSLYNNYWNNFVTDMYDSTRRLFNFKGQLPVNLLSLINLNDILIIERRSYIINNMNINLTTGEVDFELLNHIGDPV